MVWRDCVIVIYQRSSGMTMLITNTLYLFVRQHRNTIGYKYWLVRFCWQFVFYIMVLVAILLQVYDPTQGYSLKGVFIAIIAMGAIFLVLELRQFFSNPRRYVT